MGDWNLELIDISLHGAMLSMKHIVRSLLVMHLGSSFSDSELFMVIILQGCRVLFSFVICLALEQILRFQAPLFSREFESMEERSTLYLLADSGIQKGL